ncbi:MAG: hypothetical protein ACRDLL_01605 [Solirubrobacterales bacterium]
MYTVALYCPSCQAGYQAFGPDAATEIFTCRFCPRLLIEYLLDSRVEPETLGEPELCLEYPPEDCRLKPASVLAHL